LAKTIVAAVGDFYTKARRLHSAEDEPRMAALLPATTGLQALFKQKAIFSPFRGRAVFAKLCLDVLFSIFSQLTPNALSAAPLSRQRCKGEPCATVEKHLKFAG
jgi:hypothetical protein